MMHTSRLNRLPYVSDTENYDTQYECYNGKHSSHSFIEDNVDRLRYGILKYLVEAEMFDVSVSELQRRRTNSPGICITVLDPALEENSRLVTEMLLRHDAELFVWDTVSISGGWRLASSAPARAAPWLLDLMMDDVGPGDGEAEQYSGWNPLQLVVKRNGKIQASRKLLAAGVPKWKGIAFQEEWRESRRPTDTSKANRARRVAVFDMLMEEWKDCAERPPSLLILCRATIRRQCGYLGLDHKVDLLKIPVALKTYLKPS